MKELKIFAIIVFFTGVMYWGVEPYAHSIFHPHVEPANFDLAMEDINFAKSQLEKARASKANNEEIAVLEKDLQEKTDFWDSVKKINLAHGDAIKGRELFESACASCHSAVAAGFNPPMDAATASASFGVVPPDLSSAGFLYDEQFLAAVIKNPPMALLLAHHYNDDKPFPMPNYGGMGGDENEEIADIVAFIKSIAPKTMSGSEVFAAACERCHSVKYANEFAFSNLSDLNNYLGTIPPDLSIAIRAHSKQYLNDFINNTQKLLPNTLMPRVGLNQKSQTKVIEHLEEVGDAKHKERESVGLYIILYFVILSILAILWKRKVWSKLH